MKASICKTAVVTGVATLILATGVMIGANKFNKPTSIVHVVTIKWAGSATAEQKKAALAGVDKMAAEIPGITNVWTKGIKVQGEGYSDAIVMEFKDKASFDGYANHPAHKAWEKIYLPVRGQSTTHDITN